MYRGNHEADIAGEVYYCPLCRPRTACDADTNDEPFFGAAKEKCEGACVARAMSPAPYAIFHYYYYYYYFLLFHLQPKSNTCTFIAHVYVAMYA